MIEGVIENKENKKIKKKIKKIKKLGCYTYWIIKKYKNEKKIKK